MFVHLVIDRVASRPAIVMPQAAKQALPKTIEYAGKTLPVTLYRRDKFVNSSTFRSAEPDMPVCQFSEAVRQSLKLPMEAKLHCKVSGDRWILGPCLGIYLNRHSEERPFGEQTGLMTDLAKRAREVGVDLVVLTPGCMDKGIGYRYSLHARSWRLEEVPVPDVVIRRSGAFSKQQGADAVKELAAYAGLGRLHTLPRNYSNKWNLYQMLMKHSTIAPHLPRTTLATSAANVYQQALLRADVYVKPPTGARGISVFHVQSANGQLSVEWEATPPAGGRKLRRKTFRGFAAFEQFWRGVRLKQCIVQDTVLLPKTKDGRPFDFRWLIQYTDAPSVVARVARIGGQQSITTNIHTGGKPQSAMDLMKQQRWRGTGALIEQMDAIALDTAEALKREFGPYAELGIDLAVTADQEVYLFEVNPTPGRKMLRNIDAPLRKLSLDYLLEYAISAAGFARQ